MKNEGPFFLRQLFKMTGVLFTGTLVVFSTGCFGSDHSPSTTKGKLIARVFDYKLYSADLADVIPPGLNKDDSARKAEAFINSWVREKLLVHKAEQNLGNDQKDVEKQLQDYRNSLIIYAYEKELVAQKLDTVVSDDEIQKYYDGHPADFELKDNIVKFLYVKVNKKSPNQQKIPNWIKSEKPQDRKDLETYCRQFAVNYYLEDQDWLLFDDLLKEVPIETYNKELFLQNNRYITVADSSNNYYVCIKNFMTSNSHSPLAFEKENIRTIILNQRKKELIDKMNSQIYKEAMENKDIEITRN
ncbi:MAG: hypothetical protein HY064_12600 [Bacteroidetes bacterium]|nr:hypothetical protein [Bacteroidota bacterium]